MKPATRRVLTLARIAALLTGLPLLIVWAAREAALGAGWHRGLIPGVLLSQLTIVLYALRFRLSLAMAGIALRLRDALGITTQAVFYQCFVPFSIGGDLAKLLSLKAATHATPSVVAGIVLDHAVGFIGLVALASALFAYADPIGLEVSPQRLAVVAAAVLSVLLLAGYAVARRRARHLNERDGAVPGSVLGIARRHLGRLALTLVVSVVMHAGLAAAVWLGGQASGVSLDYITVLFVLTCAWTFQSIPVQFLGIGAAELVATALYTAVGLTPATALFMTSLLVCYRLLMAVTGGAWHAQAILRAQLTAAPRRPCVSVRAAPH